MHPRRAHPLPQVQKVHPWTAECGFHRCIFCTPSRYLHAAVTMNENSNMTALGNQDVKAAAIEMASAGLTAADVAGHLRLNLLQVKAWLSSEKVSHSAIAPDQRPIR